VITRKKEINVFFRVADVYHDAIIRVYGDGKEILKVKKLKAAPGEMESIKIKENLLDGVENLRFELEANA